MCPDKNQNKYMTSTTYSSTSTAAAATAAGPSDTAGRYVLRTTAINTASASGASCACFQGSAFSEMASRRERNALCGAPFLSWSGASGAETCRRDGRGGRSLARRYVGNAWRRGAHLPGAMSRSAILSPNRPPRNCSLAVDLKRKGAQKLPPWPCSG